MTRLEKQMQFIRELDKVKEITRQTYLADGSRKENDAEHSWHLAVMAALLAEYANEPIDVGHTMLMVLLHDVIEIDAGDTYAYDAAGNETKRARELVAADRIYALLPEDQAAYCRALWDEFEANETAEAKFANTLDKVQPVLLNDASGGISWKEHGVAKEQIIRRNAHTPEGSEELWAYAKGLIEKNVEKGNILP
ncbi:MAG: HD domain-containing protein [Lachnospiraceae bacterium]|nr:HD domain-containing protein [Lachnospiraceae bacterium]